MRTVAILAALLVMTIANLEVVYASWSVRFNGALEELYDSNIFLDPQGVHRPGSSKSDFRTNIMPGIDVKNESIKQKLNFKYDLLASIFINNSDQNYVGHQANFNFERFLTEHLKFFTENNVMVSEEPSSTSYDYKTVNYGRKRNLTNQNKGGIEYLMKGENSLKFYYWDRRLYYLNKDDNDLDEGIPKGLDFDDSVTYGPGVHLVYWLAFQHGIDFKYEWQRTDYDFTESQRRDYLDLRYNYKFSGHTTLYGNFIFDYIDSKGDLSTDYQIMRFLAGVEKSITNEFSIDIFGGYYKRFIDEDFKKVVQGDSNSDGFVGGATCTYKRKGWDIELKGEYGLRVEYGDYNNRGFTRFRNVSLNLIYNLNPQLNIISRFFYEYQEYPNSLANAIFGDVRREYYDALVAVEYLFLPWLSGKIQYEYAEESTSRTRLNLPVGYRDHIALIGLYANYDWLK